MKKQSHQPRKKRAPQANDTASVEESIRPYAIADKLRALRLCEAATVRFASFNRVEWLRLAPAVVSECSLPEPSRNVVSEPPVCGVSVQYLAMFKIGVLIPLMNSLL